MSPLESMLQHTSFVPEDTPLSEVAFFLGGCDAGVVGITRDGKAIGMVTDHDLIVRAVALGRDLCKFKARHVMEHMPVTVEWHADDSDLIDAAILMRRTQARHAVVTQEGKPVGVVSYKALSRYNLGEPLIAANCVQNADAPHYFADLV